MAIPALILSCFMYFPDSLQVVVAQALRARGDVVAPTWSTAVAGPCWSYHSARTGSPFPSRTYGNGSAPATTICRAPV